MEFLHPVMWHVALKSWQWIHQAAAPCNVIYGSGMTCHRIRRNVRHIRILHLVSILTTSPPSTCHSAPVSEILSKSEYYRTIVGRKKMTSYRFSRWRISAILDFRGSIIGSLKSSCATSYRSSIDTIALNCLVFENIAFFAFWGQDPRWRFSAILDFRGLIMGSVKSPLWRFYEAGSELPTAFCIKLYYMLCTLCYCCPKFRVC